MKLSFIAKIVSITFAFCLNLPALALCSDDLSIKKVNTSTVQNAATKSRKLIITIDTEAATDRALSDHVDKLIWGKFAGKEFGISRMMDIAEKHGVKLTFFVDFCEVYLYPGKFEKVCAEIIKRGHDLQIHSHAMNLPRKFWGEHGDPKASKLPRNEYEFDKVESDILMKFLVETATKMGAKTPLAQRAGSFYYNREQLESMKENGIAMSFNYSLWAPPQKYLGINFNLFEWSNDLIEVPLSYLNISGRLTPFEFNNDYFKDISKFDNFINTFYNQYGDEAVLVMLMHSWSFLEKEEKTRYFVYKDERLAKQFDDLLTMFQKQGEIITATDLYNLISKNKDLIKVKVNLNALDYSRNHLKK